MNKTAVLTGVSILLFGIIMAIISVEGLMPKIVDVTVLLLGILTTGFMLILGGLITDE